MNAHQLNHQCTYATPEELDYLRTLASVLPAGIQAVMLGAGPGVMALALMEGNPGISLTIVDNSNLHYADIHLAEAGFRDRANLWMMDSAEAAKHWDSPKIGILIVDADHNYESVKRDLEAWLPHVGAGGYVFCHDYDADGTMFSVKERYPGVKRAVDEVFDSTHFIKRVGTSIVIKL